IHEPMCVQRVVDEVSRRDLTSFQTQALTNIAWSLAVLGASSLNLMGKLAKECSTRPVQAFNSQGVANVTWAFACADALKDADVARWFARSDDFSADQRNTQQAQQLFDAAVAWRIECSNLQLPPLLEHLMRGDWVMPLVEARRGFEHASSRTHL